MGCYFRLASSNTLMLLAKEIPELKIDCDCRKLKPGMPLKAAEELNIDLNASYTIGGF